MSERTSVDAGHRTADAPLFANEVKRGRNNNRRAADKMNGYAFAPKQIAKQSAPDQLRILKRSDRRCGRVFEGLCEKSPPQPTKNAGATERKKGS